jgi:hypothetical protein
MDSPHRIRGARDGDRRSQPTYLTPEDRRRYPASIPRALTGDSGCKASAIADVAFTAIKSLPADGRRASSRRVLLARVLMF